MNRNLKALFFKSSGYTPEEVDEMIYRQKAVKQALKQQKERIQCEKRIIKIVKMTDRVKKLTSKILNRNDYRMAKLSSTVLYSELKKSKPERLKEQIQNGWDLAAKWQKESGVSKGKLKG